MGPLDPFPEQDHLITESYFEIFGLWQEITAAHCHEVVAMFEYQEFWHLRRGQLSTVVKNFFGK